MEHQSQCLLEPADCLQCQLSKLADGLLSGRYSQAVQTNETESEAPGQDGITPAMFKTLIGKGHEEFATMRQQVGRDYILLNFNVIVKTLLSYLCIRMLLNSFNIS